MYGVPDPEPWCPRNPELLIEICVWCPPNPVMVSPEPSQVYVWCLRNPRNPRNLNLCMVSPEPASMVPPEPSMVSPEPRFMYGVSGTLGTQIYVWCPRNRGGVPGTAYGVPGTA